MTRILFAALILCLGPALLFADPTPLDSKSPNLSKPDISYFFDSISFDHGTWKFELSRNSTGLLWRTIAGGKDAAFCVGVEKQVLVVPQASSLEIKNKDFVLLFRPQEPYDAGDPPAYIVLFSIGTGDHLVHRGGNSTLLELGKDGVWIIVTGDDG